MKFHLARPFTRAFDCEESEVLCLCLTLLSYSGLFHTNFAACIKQLLADQVSEGSRWEIASCPVRAASCVIGRVWDETVAVKEVVGYWMMINHQLIYCKWDVDAFELWQNVAMNQMLCIFLPFYMQKTRKPKLFYVERNFWISLLGLTLWMTAWRLEAKPPNPVSVWRPSARRWFQSCQGTYRQRPQRPPTALNLKVSKLLWILKLGDQKKEWNFEVSICFTETQQLPILSWIFFIVMVCEFCCSSRVGLAALLLSDLPSHGSSQRPGALHIRKIRGWKGPKMHFPMQIRKASYGHVTWETEYLMNECDQQHLSRKD